MCDTRQVFRYGSSTTLERKATKLGDKTAGQAVKGIIYVDIDIYLPPPSPHLHRPGAYGYPSCSSPSVRSDQGAGHAGLLTVRMPRICGPQANGWPDIGIRYRSGNGSSWDLHTLWAPIQEKPTRCHFSERNCSPGLLGWIPTLTSLEQPRGGVWTLRVIFESLVVVIDSPLPQSCVS